MLAWGEMARQIAHEIKNPLTPIKLAVQHLRRAVAPAPPDPDTHARVRLDVEHIAAAAVLGDHPQNVAFDGFADRCAPRLTGLPTDGLEDHHTRKR